MMDEIASHIMDIVANSVTAKATHISIDIVKDTDRKDLTLIIKDNGIGMDNETKKKVLDPFYTTKTGKKVGLGVPLLKGTAETTGGTFHLSSVIGQGTEIAASFDLSHPDLPPLGNIRDTMLVLVVGNPETDFHFHLKMDSKEFTLDTKEIKSLLGDVPINHPEVIIFLSKYIDENM
jgi:signal transduction histidine kinase